MSLKPEQIYSEIEAILAPLASESRRTAIEEILEPITNARDELLALFRRDKGTPDPSLPPLDPGAPRRKMIIEIEVSDDFENRLDNQWMVEREIHADRWIWKWKPQLPPEPPAMEADKGEKK